MSDTQKNNNNRAGIYIGLILLQDILFGVNDPITKILLKTVPVYIFLAFRYTVAVGILLLLFGKQILKDVKTVPLRKYILPAVCLGLNFLTGNTAIKLTAATNVAFLKSLSGIFVSLLLLVFYKKKYTVKLLLLHITLAVGLYLLTAKGGLSAFGAGEILALCSALLSAGALVFGASAVKSVSPVTLTAAQALSSAVICTVLGLVSGVFRETELVPLLTRTNLLIFAFEVLVCTILGNQIQNRALRYIPSALIGILQCACPIVTAVSAYLILNERLSIAGIIGAGLILICILIDRFTKMTQK